MQGEFVLCVRRPDGAVDYMPCKSWASACGKLAHLAYDYEKVWVRDAVGGAIILVFDKRASMNRP